MNTVTQAARDEAYRRRVGAALDASFARAQGREAAEGIRSLDLATDRWIIFSDQHRGARNGADDFMRCERGYNAALAYYFKQGHTLVVLGDVEELWEENPGPVLHAYGHTMALETAFHRQGRYLRFWGNHDDEWDSDRAVERLLVPIYGEPLIVRESLLVKIMDGAQTFGDLYLVHGHQGDPGSDQYASFSRLIMRYLWRPWQRLTGASSNTPAKDWQLREKHNTALYTWAEKHSKLLLIAGHTHRPVFKSQTHVDQIQRELDELEARLASTPDDKRLRDVVSRLAAELEWGRAQDQQITGEEGASVPMAKPCYFNSGCCCFLDGNVTGIEIAGGEIRLVRWPDDQGQPRPRVLASASLKSVLAAC